MTVAFDVASSANSAGLQTASQNLTLPAMTPGALIIVGVEAFVPAAFTPSVASTGTALAQLGSTQTSGLLAGFVSCGSLWTAVAAAHDSGAVVTVSGASAFWAVWAACYTGAVADVQAGDGSPGSPASWPTPAAVTVLAGDWELAVALAAVQTPPITPPAGMTVRASTSAAGVTAIIADTAASVGGAGTHIGGRVFSSASANTWWTAFTVGAGAPVVPVAGRRGVPDDGDRMRRRLARLRRAGIAG